jgi:hypothetical protein
MLLLDRTRARAQRRQLSVKHRLAMFGLAIALSLTSRLTPAQEMKLPKDVDFGGSGLVQFKYACDRELCSVRCYMTGNLVLEVKEAKAATFTSYRSHGRQNAPEKDIFVVSKSDEPSYMNFAGDGGCVFSGMRQESTTGFVSRTTIGTPPSR